MAFDQGLADRIRNQLTGHPGLTEKKMFGGIAFMISGNMCCGVSNESLMLRLGVDGAEQAFAQDYVSTFGPTPDRPMKGWVLVGPEAISEDQDLAAWLQKGLVFTESLPPK